MILIIKVVDSIMGSGKTSAAINHMNDNKDTSYIYITPYLSEIERIKENTSKKFYEPSIYSKKGETYFKLDSLHSLLSHNKNIATTHSLFKKANEKTRDLLHAGNYVLILDEVMDVVTQLNVSKSDVDMLMKEWMYINNGYVLWDIDKEESVGKYTGEFQTVRQMALNHNLIIHNGTILIWQFPAEIFKLFKEVYILTYLFDAQIQKYYYDLHNLEYKKYIAAFENDKHIFSPKPFHNNEKELKDNLKQLISIYEGDLNKIGEKEFSLSKSWYNNKKHMHIKLKNNVINYFQNKIKTKSDYNMWTTYKDYQNKIKGKGYTKGFVSCSARATNDYQHKNALAYTINRYLNPVIKDYFYSHNVKVNEDLYALSELLQWVWRSDIRNGNKIDIYIPSKRMRDIFIEWLNDEL